MSDSMLSLEFETECNDRDVAALRLVSVRGSEGLATPYRYELSLVSESDQGLSAEAIDAWLAQPCRFRWSMGENGAEAAGMVASLVLEPTIDPRWVVYRATLVPRFYARASRAVRSRVFQDATPLEIVAAVLKEH